MNDIPLNEVAALRKQLGETTARLERMFEYVEKTLHVASTHFDTYQHRSGRPYYALDDGWGLTSLDTGQPFFVNTRDRNLTPWIIMGGHWEPNVGASLLAYAQPGMTVLDIGAHIGYYTVKLGSKVAPNGRVWSFEPNPAVSDVCLENIKINGLAPVVTLNRFALGDKRDQVTLTYSNSNMTSANLLGEQTADVSLDVDVFKLDDVIPADVSIDLIKLDAEGYEKLILDGGKVTLERSPQCAIMIELGLDRWERLAPLDELMPICGAHKTAYAVQPDGSVYPIHFSEMREFLLTCAYHENYFLIAPPDLAQRYIGGLIRPSTR